MNQTSYLLRRILEIIVHNYTIVTPSVTQTSHYSVVLAEIPSEPEIRHDLRMLAKDLFTDLMAVVLASVIYQDHLQVERRQTGH